MLWLLANLLSLPGDGTVLVLEQEEFFAIETTTPSPTPVPSILVTQEQVVQETELSLLYMIYCLQEQLNVIMSLCLFMMCGILCCVGCTRKTMSRDPVIVDARPILDAVVTDGGKK